MTIYNFEFEFLPTSVNASYRSFKNKVYKSKKLKDFQKQVTEFFENNKGFEKLEGDLTIDITFEIKGFRKRDLDNMLKSLFDALENILFENDNQIFDIRCRKIMNCKSNKTKIILCES
jgi:Holliday junction resolvase RusA-like endonuclease